MCLVSTFTIRTAPVEKRSLDKVHTIEVRLKSVATVIPSVRFEVFSEKPKYGKSTCFGTVVNTFLATDVFEDTKSFFALSNEQIAENPTVHSGSFPKKIVIFQHRLCWLWPIELIIFHRMKFYCSLGWCEKSKNIGINHQWGPTQWKANGSINQWHNENYWIFLSFIHTMPVSQCKMLYCYS